MTGADNNSSLNYTAAGKSLCDAIDALDAYDLFCSLAIIIRLDQMELMLLLFTLSGCWQPVSWISLPKRIIYSAYRTFLISILSTFALSQFMNILLSLDNPDEITDSIYMTLSMSIATYKMITIWLNRKTIKGILDVLTKKPFKTMEPREEIIYQKNNKAVTKCVLSYLILCYVTIAFIILQSVFTDRVKRKLPYSAWLPYDYVPIAIFYPTYIHQLTGIIVGASVNIACESLISGLLQQICCQIEILEYRLTKISHDERVLGNCVRHHDLIYEYANMVNTHFAKIVGMQFAVSMLVMCATLYKLVESTAITDFIILMMYTGCVLLQILLYCWFGNQLKLKSTSLSNNIYNMDWWTLDDSKKKALLLMMRRSTVPIEFNTAIIITLNLDSFVALLKMSYSAFNLLHQTQEW